MKLAIMPFENIKNNKQYDWLKKGIAESLTQCFSKVPDFRLIERNQLSQIIREQGLSMTGVISEKDAVKAGRLLSANMIMVGSFQVYGSRILINSRIVDVEKGMVIKKSIIKVNGSIKNIFSLYEKLADRFLIAYNIKLEKKQKKIFMDVVKSTDSIDAYKLYLKGRSALLEFNLKSYKKAINYFDDAVLEDPRYSLAYAGLSEAYALLGHEKETINRHIQKYGESSSSISQRRGEARRYFIKSLGYGKTAVSLAPSLSEAHRAQALAFYYMGRYDDAKVEAMTLLALNRKDPYGYYLIGAIENSDRKVKYLKKALRIDPNFGLAYFELGNYYLKQRNLTRALYYYKQGAEKLPCNADVQSATAFILLRKGQGKSSYRYFKRVMKYRGDDSYSTLGFAIASNLMGKRKQAVRFFDKAMKSNWQFYGSAYVLKKTYRWNSTMIRAWGRLKDDYKNRKR